MIGGFASAIKGMMRDDQVMILAAVLAVGLVEDIAVSRRPAALPLWMPYEFSWGVYLATTLGIAWFFRGIAASPESERPRPWRRFAFCLGVGLIYAAMQTHYDYAAQHMFFLHRLQHLVLHHTGPLLIALSHPAVMIARGMPPVLLHRLQARWIMRAIDWVQQPAIATFLFVGLIYLWPAPPVHFYAMLDPRLYTVMNWSVTVDGILFWALILDPRPAPAAPLSYGGRALICIGIMFPQILLGAAVAFSTRDHFEVYEICGRILPMTGLQDQQLGGLILWIPGAMMSVVGALLVLNFMRLDEEAEAPSTTEGGSIHA